MHQEAPFDLLVVDWALPDGGAEGLCRRFRSLPGGRHLPILAVTEGAQPSDAATALAVGASDCIEAPLQDGQVGMRLLVAERQVRSRAPTDSSALQEHHLLADRMAAVGVLAAGMAHELNNPLAYVLANVRLLREELEAQGAQGASERVAHMRELVDESVHGLERMRTIVRDLKTFSRTDDERHDVVDVHRVVRACLNMCSNELRHRARLEVDLGPTPPVSINESRLAQVVLNLLINAAQALAPSQRDDRIIVRTGGEGGQVVLEVTDSGAGIPPEDVARIFDPFYTTKGPGEGTGLGLSVCRNIITAAGGDIQVDSEPGGGTRFRILLPVAKAPRAAVPETPRPPPLTNGDHPRLLVVDDEPMVGRSLRRVLREHDVTVVSDGRQAVDLLTSNGGRFDLVLCDLMMPGMSGMEVFSAVTGARPDLADRFVFMTGGAFTPHARAFLDEIANDHIEKPFDPHRVRTLVRERTQT
jgi:signal transduction histidine kinase